MTIRLSVIVPTHRAPADLARCLDALRSSDLPQDEWELIVVDDGSDDAETSRVSAKADQVVTLPPPASGPAKARNSGVDVSRASIVAFIDADVLVHRDALRLMLAAFDDKSTSAVFGSYDDTPAALQLVSQYRNLLHHRVHQRNAGDVDSFWAGCGGVRKDVFTATGMFDAAKYTRPEMEDVELGYRLRDGGHRIVLDPRILCTHLKRWTLGGMIRGDFSRRGVPWARLLAERKILLKPKGLSLGVVERLSALLACSAVAIALAAVLSSSGDLGLLALATFIMFAVVNGELFAWLAHIRGSWFAIRAVPLHLIYSVVAVSALLWGSLTKRSRV